MSQVSFGIELPQHLGFAHLRAMACAAEDLGYDSVWVRDHLIVDAREMASFQQGYIADGERKVSGEYLACIPALAALAAVTKRITIGTDVLNLPRRNPVDVANEMACIDQISGGRLILQAAVGNPRRDWAASGVRTPVSARGKMLEEALTIIRLLWTSDDPVSFDGEYYQIEGARLGNRPVQRPHPPIWLGVRTTFGRVARFADGFTLSESMFGGDFATFGRALEAIRAEAVSIGRNPGKITAAARFALVASPDGAQARLRASADWGRLFMEPAEWYSDWAGNADLICDLINPWIAAGVRHILLWPIPYGPGEDFLADITYFAGNVMARYRDPA
jgi:alkanesulfonate monooxygenase SsuD/methylene tetrahydromethanopterin reductase-like flavin-dependent oxidoreductase (luciferase family)